LFDCFAFIFALNKNYFMKRIVLILTCLFATSVSFSQILFTEDFNYTSQGAGADTLTNAAIGGSKWTRHSGGSGIIKDVKFLATGLNYTGYAGSGVGGAIGFQHTVGSEDVNASIGDADSLGSLYAAFMLKIDSSGGRDTLTDYFFHLADVAGTSVTNIRARLFACNGSDSSKFRLGVSKGTAAKLTAANITAGAKAPQFTTTEFNVGQTYLIVLKYTFNSGTTKDDEIKLFVIASGVPATEPTADVTFTDNGISDLTKIKTVCVRQGSIGRTMGTIDGIRVFTTWDAATVALLPIKLTSFTAVGLRDAVNVNWNALCNSTTCMFNVERSIDGINFETISTVNGNTTSNVYAMSDKKLPKTNALYYRIKTINADGKFDYSNIQKVKIGTVNLTVSPNPASNELLINASSNITSVEIFNLQGKSCLVNKGNNTNSIKVSIANLAEGTYLVNTMAGGESTSSKIVVKH
jgi:Secretion system C-terminal sorting domain